MARAQATTDHQVIRRWIETHNGHPSVVRATQGRKKGSAGLLRVDFDEPEDSLEEVSWDDFFDTFDQNNLAFLFQNEQDSRFHKFVNRDSVEEDSDDEGEADSSTSSSQKSASASSRTNSGGKTRQASPAEEEEAEEVDEEDVEEDEEEDFDEDELDEDDEDEDEDDDDDDEEDEEDEDEDEKPARGKKR